MKQFQVIYKTDTGEMTSNYSVEVSALSIRDAINKACEVREHVNMIINVIYLKPTI